MYTITHHYLTVGDDGAPIVEVETATWNGDDADELAVRVRRMIEHPGGRSGTTITITVGLTESTSI